MGKPNQHPVWQELQQMQQEFRAQSLDGLFAADKERSKKFTWQQGVLSLDASRTHIDQTVIAKLITLAEKQDLAGWRSKLFSGDLINNTESRAVLHSALRTASNQPVCVNGKDVIPTIRSIQQKMEKFVSSVRNGTWLGATGKPIKQIINIGIGGSDLGPRLVVDALRPMPNRLPVCFIANVDAAEIAKIQKFDLSETLCIIVSKTFTTQETLLNAKAIRNNLVSQLGEQAVERHFIAVSTNIEAAKQFGISSENIFPLWDWVGGRFSLWSAVGLSIALAIGWENFKNLLAGAAAMDQHFLNAPLSQNLPVLHALTCIWYRNFWNCASQAILPYDERLRELPRYLQQLIMESNGKSVTREGEPLDYQTAPVIFGECGTVGQHSFHQCLHQGTALIPADFISIGQDDWQQPDHHQALLNNLKGQIAALQSGAVSEQPWQTNQGNKPTFLLGLQRLDSFHLGQLIAHYEHKTFVEGVIWGINSFDQWGVELGKKLAKQAALAASK